MFAGFAAIGGAIGAYCALFARVMVAVDRREYRLVVWSILAFAAVCYGLWEGMCRSRPWVPSPKWIVPRSWTGMLTRAQFYSMFGLAMGAGVFTQVTFVGVYLLYIDGLMLPPARACLVMAVFGMARGIPHILAAWALDPYARRHLAIPIGLGEGIRQLGWTGQRRVRSVALVVFAVACIVRIVAEGS